MPRKRNAFHYAKPSAPAHPSLATGKSQPMSPASINSVNEKLQQLRIEQQRSQSSKSSSSPQAPPKHPLPPSVQRVLQIPQAPSPRPRPGLTVRGGRRGPAGPPPPGSWLQKHKMGNISSETAAYLTIDRTVVTSVALPGLNLPGKGTLEDTSLKNIARTWDSHVADCTGFLATLDVNFKELLLYYIARYSPNGIDGNALKVLFFDKYELEGATGAEELRNLDVSTSVGDPLSFRDFKDFFYKRDFFPDLIDPKAFDEVPDAVLGDWDAPTGPIGGLAYPPKFTNLTQLSLAHPQRVVTWRPLIALAKHLASLSHLSLAYWPKPTLHPNSNTSYYPTPTGPVQSSSETFYNDDLEYFDSSADVLRQLSRNLTRLEWLDLTGCYPWVKCLVDQRIDWFGAWARLETVIVDQGHQPVLIKQAPVSERRRDWEFCIRNYYNVKDDRMDRRARRRELENWLRNEFGLARLEYWLKLIVKGDVHRGDENGTDWYEFESRCDAALGEYDPTWGPEPGVKPALASPRSPKMDLIYATKNPLIRDFVKLVHEIFAKDGITPRGLHQDIGDK